MWNRYQVPRRTWIDDLVVGSVVRSKRSSTLRTCVEVLRVDTRLGPRVWSVSFPILHCSWTKRGHTGYQRGEALRSFRPTRAKVRLADYPTLLLVKRDLALGGGQYVEGSRCCDVVGVVT